jgi:hypothetical protein
MNAAATILNPLNNLLYLASAFANEKYFERKSNDSIAHFHWSL